MSHGVDTGHSAEPNLTPLLDVVLQLLMFFMMCVNFVTEQVNEDIKLPDSQSATPMDKADVDVLFINLKKFSSQEYENKVSGSVLTQLQEKFKEGDPLVQVVGKDPMRIVELKYWLKGQFEDAEKLSKDGKVKTAVIIRADRLTNYAQVYQILQMCKVQGYTQLRLRAYTKSGKVT